MRSHSLRALLLLLTLAAMCHAQLSREVANRQVEMVVTLGFDDGSPLQSQQSGMNGASDAGRKTRETSGEHSRDASFNTQIRVQLQETSGAVLDEKSPNAEGKVSFMVRNGNEFRVRVFGPDIEETFVENLQPAFGDKLVSVLLHRKGAPAVERATETTISAKRLKAPEAAKKAVERGAQALRQQDYLEAKRSFQKAIELYPEYDLAYNNLGVVLMELGDTEGGERAFSKAVELNANFPRALINLAKVELNRKDYPRAEGYLSRAVVTDPLNAQAYFLLAQAHFFAGQNDATIADVKKLHTLAHAEYALSHYLAGKAYRAQGANAEATAELQTFITEDSKDPNVPAAQQLLQEISAGRPTPK